MARSVVFISQLEVEQQIKWMTLLKSALPNENIVLANELSSKQRDQCQVAIVANPSRQQMNSFTKLQWVQSLWAGVENLIQPAKQSGFALTRLVDPQLAETMSEAVLAWTLYLHRKMPTYQQQQQKKQWKQQTYINANDCHVGLLGMGNLGQISAQRLVSNGFNVSAWSQHKKSLTNVNCFYGKQGLKNMIKNCHIIICLLPSTPLTKNLLNKSFFAQLNDNTSIINFARGDLLVTKDLIEILNKNGLYHAVLDVFVQEPLEQKSPLWQHPKITVLPHIAATTNSTTAVNIVANNFNYYRKNHKPFNQVDLDKGY